MDISKILKSGESEKVEFKASFGKAVIMALVAFANSSGGKVVVGVDDNGSPIGIEAGAETQQRYLNDIKTATYPQIIPHITSFEIEGRFILVFEINEYPVKPVSYKNRYYKRVRNSNHLLSLDEIVDLQQQSLHISYDAYPLKERLDALDPALMEKFLQTANTTGRVNLGDDLMTNLTKLKLVQNGQPTLAAMLLFGNHGYSIHVGRFKAADTIIDDLLIKAPLIPALEEAMVFIKKHINLSYHFDGGLKRKERWQYPLEAVRELLLNAVVHRDYKNTSDVVIKIFDNRILFTNPGRIYGNLTIEDLKRDDYVSSIRNKLLAEAFYLMGDIEKYGTGFLRIRQWLGKYPEISYDIREIGDFFSVEIRQETSDDLRNDLKTDGKDLRNDVRDLRNDLTARYDLTDNQLEIVLAVMENKYITQQQLSQYIGISPKNVRNNMEKLKSIGILQRIGPQKGGHWEITLAGK
jgi:ATP-dependent DNA helicase RecG